MTVRPLDFGDPFPSDKDDIAPARPTSPFVERNYRVNNARVPTSKVTPPTKAAADLHIEPKQKPNRVSFQGVIVKREKENYYTVLRQDGKRISAYIDGDDCVYDALKIGNDVILVEGQQPGFWQIISAPRQNEMESIRVTNGAIGPISTIATQIPFTRHREMTGDEHDAYFSVDNDGTITVLRDLTGEVELSITVYLTSTDKSSNNKVKVKVLNDVRYSNDDLYIEFQVTEIEINADQVTQQPAWIAKLALDTCPGVY